jgi:hypothetical protein
MDGRYGQFALVLPEQDMVVAITAGTKSNRAIPNLVWETLLPAVRADALPEDTAAQLELRELMRAQELPVSAYLKTDPPLAARIGGRKIALPFNLLGASTLALDFLAETIDLTVQRRSGGVEVLPAGRQRWVSGVTHMWPHEEMDRASLESRAGWLDMSTLEIRQQCVETPFARNWRLEFDGSDHVEVSVGLDNGFWVERTEVLRGELS